MINSKEKYIKNIIFSIITILYTFFFIGVLTLPIGTVLEKNVTTLYNDIKYNIIKPKNIDVSNFNITKDASYEMGFLSKIKIENTYNFDFKYNFIYDEDLIELKSFAYNELTFYPNFKDSDYSTNITILISKYDSFKIDVSVNVITPNYNNLNFTHGTHGYLYRKESKYILQKDLPLYIQGFLFKDVDGENLFSNQSLLNYEYDRNYFYYDIKNYTLIPKRKGENLEFKIYSKIKSKTIKIDIIDPDDKNIDFSNICLEDIYGNITSLNKAETKKTYSFHFYNKYGEDLLSKYDLKTDASKVHYKKEYETILFHTIGQIKL